MQDERKTFFGFIPNVKFENKYNKKSANGHIIYAYNIQFNKNNNDNNILLFTVQSKTP